MNTKRRIHDAIVGVALVVGTALGTYVAPAWNLVPAILGVTLLQSGLTGFCPVYFILDRTLGIEGSACNAKAPAR